MTDAWHHSHAPARSWRCGAWELEVRDDELADIRYEGRIALRSIRAVVRDHDWNTAAWRILAIDESEASLTLRLRTRDLGADIDATLTVIAHQGVLTADLAATTHIDYLTNRTGLVVLHPPGVAGAPLTLTRPDGSRETTRFPLEISPHQPVREIAALAWAHDGLEVRTGFEGDVFEMEDQRNWTDASFKTYSRPLDLPFPYPLAAGDEVRQRITVRVRPDGSRAAATSGATGAEPEEIVLGEPVRMPEIGLAAASAPDPAPPGDDPVTGPVLVELDLSTTNWRAALERARRTGRPLDARLVVGDDLDAIADAARALAGTPLRRVGAFRAGGHPLRHVSDRPLVAAVRAAFSDRDDLEIVGGSRSHFTEFNRERARIPVDELDGVAITLTPLFHSLTTEQLVESVAMQRLVARQSVAMAASRPVHIGPVSLRPRFNDVATAPAPVPTRPDLSEGYGAHLTGAADARMADAATAAWTIAATTAMTLAGVSSLSWFEQWGPRGVRTAEGERLPVSEALRALSARSGTTVRTGATADGLVWALAGDAGVLVANIDERTRSVSVAGDAIAVPPLTSRQIAPLGPKETP